MLLCWSASLSSQRMSPWAGDNRAKLLPNLFWRPVLVLDMYDNRTTLGYNFDVIPVCYRFQPRRIWVNFCYRTIFAFWKADLLHNSYSSLAVSLPSFLISHSLIFSSSYDVPLLPFLFYSFHDLWIRPKKQTNKDNSSMNNVMYILSYCMRRSSLH